MTHTPTSIEIAAAELSGTRHTAVSAADQRRLFGAVVFGRMPVKRMRAGISIQWQTISRDYCYQSFSYAQVADATNAGKKLQVQR